MIGQKNLIEKIDTLIDNGRFPNNVIICGKQNSCQEDIARYIVEKLSAEIVRLDDAKMDTIRSMISEVNSVSNVAYIIPNLDEAQFRVKYTLLKTLEERLSNTYFIITCSNIGNLYEPIRSRCQILYLDNYSSEDIKEYIEIKCPGLSKEDKKILISSCDTLYEVDRFVEYGVSEFSSFVDKVIDKFQTVIPANGLKISEKIAKKKSDKGYDLILFFKMIVYNLLKRELNDLTLKEIAVTTRYLSELSYASVNRQMIYDMWYFDMLGVTKA